jgi:hypothetical protein
MRVEREGQWLPLEYQVRFTLHQESRIFCIE